MPPTKGAATAAKQRQHSAKRTDTGCSKAQPNPTSNKAAEKLRVQNPAALRSFLSTAAAPSTRQQLRHLELTEKLPVKLYEELAECILGNSSTSSSNNRSSSGCPALEVVSLAGSCCGDAALLVSGLTRGWMSGRAFSACTTPTATTLAASVAGGRISAASV